MLQHILGTIGLSAADRQLIANLYDRASFAIRAPFGRTADIPLRVGVRQGCALSCVLSNIMIHALLRYIQSTGHTFTHTVDRETRDRAIERAAHPAGEAAVPFLDAPQEGPAAYADDLALLLASTDARHTASQLQDIVHRMGEFCDWAGLEVSALKTEVTGYDFASGKDLLPTMSYKGGTLPRRPATEPFKYLGMRVSLTGDTSAERNYVLARTAKLVRMLRRHVLTPRQAERVVDMAIGPVFRYSAAFTAWSTNDLRRLRQRVMGSLMLTATNKEYHSRHGVAAMTA